MYFLTFLNDLYVQLKATGSGVPIDNDIVCIFLYADDVVLITEDETGIQFLLNVSSNWCLLNAMQSTEE